MARYWVPIYNTTGTAIPVEADSPEQAAATWEESDAFQELGGLCHACEHEVGALGDWELTADAPTLTADEIRAAIHDGLDVLPIGVAPSILDGIVERIVALLDRPADPLPHITLEED